METSFDPVVSMMLNALSYELEKVAHELEDSKTRIVERVLEIMFPEVVSGAKPARAVAHAFPTENNRKTSLQNQMLVKRRLHNIYNPLEPIIKEIVLSPTLEVKLAPCNIGYIAYERNMFKISNLFYKDTVKDYKHTLPAGEIVLGIELNDENVELEDLMLYIDIKNTHQKEMFHYYLKQVKCFYDNIEIKVEEGYNVPLNSLDIKNIINRNYSHLNEIMQEINEYYFDNFYTLKGGLKYKKISEYSSECKYLEEITNNAAKPIIWIKLVFPESLVPQIIENVSFTANCFPVMNKKRHSLGIGLGLGNFLSYVALETGNNIYLDIESVIDPLNNHYEIKEFKEGVVEEGNAVLRIGGVSRFDSRTASELLQNLLDLLKDETSSFSGLGKDFMTSSLSQISQLLASVEQQAKESSFLKNNDPYLMIKPKIEKNMENSFQINYWSTCAEEGNDVKTGTVLESSDLTFVSNSITLMTNTAGGLNKQSNKDRILAYRNALLTRGRIVTFADIKAFGFNHFKNSILEIKIEKGTRKEISVKAGFSRTVDIYIKTNLEEKQHLSDSEWEYLCDSFMKNLKSRSSNVFPYRIFIDE
ncbi:type VI secretion system baseplate subunit TssF [Flavobacterium sp.]|uniref:type VI secretion system baseplate subunit TssF n=1 Tax=Flavobacterium sp. TaxID=239 RepID=UPI0031DC93B2